MAASPKTTDLRSAPTAPSHGNTPVAAELEGKGLSPSVPPQRYSPVAGRYTALEQARHDARLNAQLGRLDDKYAELLNTADSARTPAAARRVTSQISTLRADAGDLADSAEAAVGTATHISIEARARSQAIHDGTTRIVRHVEADREAPVSKVRVRENSPFRGVRGPSRQVEPTLSPEEQTIRSLHEGRGVLLGDLQAAGIEPVTKHDNMYAIALRGPVNIERDRKGHEQLVADVTITWRHGPPTRLSRFPLIGSAEARQALVAKGDNREELAFSA